MDRVNSKQNYPNTSQTTIQEYKQNQDIFQTKAKNL